MNPVQRLIEAELYARNAGEALRADTLKEIREVLAALTTAFVEMSTTIECIRAECLTPNTTKGMNLAQFRGQIDGFCKSGLRAAGYEIVEE